MLSQVDELVITPYSTFGAAAVVTRRSAKPPLAVQYANIPGKQSFYSCVRLPSEQPPCHICGMNRYEFFELPTRAYLASRFLPEQAVEARQCKDRIARAAEETTLDFLPPSNFPINHAFNHLVNYAGIRIAKGTHELSRYVMYFPSYIATMAVIVVVLVCSIMRRQQVKMFVASLWRWLSSSTFLRRRTKVAETPHESV